MNYEQIRTLLNGDEFIARRIIPGLKQGRDQFGFKKQDLLNAGVDEGDLLARLGPSWSAYRGPSAWDVIFVRSIPARQAILQIYQAFRGRTPLSWRPV